MNKFIDDVFDSWLLAISVFFLLLAGVQMLVVFALAFLALSVATFYVFVSSATCCALCIFFMSLYSVSDL